jgi:hypothetical protein
MFWGYLKKVEKDLENFPPDEFPSLFERYENLLSAGLKNLSLSKEDLKKRSEFNFDSGNAANLEAGIAMLRVTEALRLRGFSEMRLVRPSQGQLSADIICTKNGHRVCCEVKAITKQSAGRKGLFLEDQFYVKLLEYICKARNQLEATASRLQCTVKIFVSVVNWFSQSIHLSEADYQQVVNRLEKDQDQQSLEGIDGVLFVTKMGQDFLFLNEEAHCVG